MKQVIEIKNIRTLTAMGYLLIALLVSGIVYTWFSEWRDMERLETMNRQIESFRKEINIIHIQLIKFSLLGESVLEWDDEDLECYHIQRMAMDSMLCRFKTIYPVERIDSVRHLLADKELQMRWIVQVLDDSKHTALLRPYAGYAQYLVGLLPFRQWQRTTTSFTLPNFSNHAHT